MREIDAQTSWSLAHMATIYARFEDGEAAMQCLNNLAKSAMVNNLFTLHNDWRKMNISLAMDPPIQLDAVMGYVNALQEMLLYTTNDFMKLLPALPKVLSQGSVKKFRYVNGYVDMTWDIDKNEFVASLKAIRDHEMYIQLPEFFNNYQFINEDCSVTREKSLYHVKMKKSSWLEIRTFGDFLQ